VLPESYAVCRLDPGASVPARAGISLIVVCTYDTDYLLVRNPDLDRAIASLETIGCRIGQ
jgi:hypothetical protein